jgi:diguanylate cyclase (GGDEF)-like protein
VLEPVGQDRPRRLTAREARAEAASATAYLAVAAAMAAALDSGRPFPATTAVLLVGAYAIASRIRLHVGAGFALPTQLVLVPMLLDLPAPAVPAAAGLGVLLGTLGGVLTRRAHPERALTGLGDAWPVVAGSLVVLWAGEPEAGTAAIPVVLCALVAQCCVDLVTATARQGLRRTIAPSVPLRVVAVVFLIDLALTPVGVLAAAAGLREPIALLAVVALLGLLAAAAAERRTRIREAVSRLEALQDERARLERALRRVADAFAAKLDRAALVDLTLQTALDALRADRAIAVLPGGRTGCGAPADPAASRALVGAVTAARRSRRTSTHAAEGHVAMAHPLDAGHGVVCVSRRGPAFSEEEQELFGHLCRQAVVAIENVELHDLLRRQATEDELTGLANHRHFQGVLAREVARAGRTGQPVSLLMLDIDDFKAVNDTFGHQEGDAVLRSVARAVRDVCRRTDEPARYGGEELAVVLPDTAGEGAYVLAEELRAAVGRLHLLPDGPGRPVTVSVGVATLAGTADTPRALLTAADAALYDAKRTGKNRTVRAVAAPAPPAAGVRAAPRGDDARHEPERAVPRPATAERPVGRRTGRGGRAARSLVARAVRHVP